MIEVNLDNEKYKKENEMRQLAKDSRDLKEICLELNAIIHEQDQEFHDIENNLDKAYVSILDTNKRLDKTKKLMKKNLLLKTVAVVGLGVAGSLSGGLLGGYLLGHTIVGGVIGLFGGGSIFSSAAVLINS